jgi:hypothetical protein
MRKVASIGIFIGALAVAVLPARADDQIIGFAAGQFGSSAQQLDLRPGNTALSSDQRRFRR